MTVRLGSGEWSFEVHENWAKIPDEIVLGDCAAVGVDSKDNVYAFNRYPDQIITMYGPDGGVSAGPFVYLNTLGHARVRFPFVFQTPVDGNFSPWGATWSMQVEQAVTHSLRLRASYMLNDSAGLAILNSVAPDPETNRGSYLLEGSGQSRYRQFETTARLRVGKDRLEVDLAETLKREQILRLVGSTTARIEFLGGGTGAFRVRSPDQPISLATNLLRLLEGSAI